MIPEERVRWLAKLRVGDEVMQVHDLKRMPSSQWTIYAIDETLIRIKRLTARRTYRRSNGREAGGFAWHLEPVANSPAK